MSEGDACALVKLNGLVFLAVVELVAAVAADDDAAVAAAEVAVDELLVLLKLNGAVEAADELVVELEVVLGVVPDGYARGAEYLYQSPVWSAQNADTQHATPLPNPFAGRLHAKRRATSERFAPRALALAS